MIYYHVDVFSKGPLTGNGLTVLLCDTMPSADIMQKIAKEMKQYETIFLCRRKTHEYDARIFTVEEELQFAGHPILGAAAAVCAQDNYVTNTSDKTGQNNIGSTGINSHLTKVISFHLINKDVNVSCECIAGGREYSCTMDQGVISVIGTVEKSDVASLIKPLHIDEGDIDERFPLEVCSAGLPYLIVPVKKGIEKAGIFTAGYEEMLAKHGAKFVYILDINSIEGRSFDNSGLEDVATGSAAGPGGDYLVRHGICRQGQNTIIRQGRFLDRPSEIVFCKEPNGSMLVSGGVSIIARGTFEV